jgi:hypothetical protein
MYDGEAAFATNSKPSWPVRTALDVWIDLPVVGENQTVEQERDVCTAIDTLKLTRREKSEAVSWPRWCCARRLLSLGLPSPARPPPSTEKLRSCTSGIPPWIPALQLRKARLGLQSSI